MDYQVVPIPGFHSLNPKLQNSNYKQTPKHNIQIRNRSSNTVARMNQVHSMHGLYSVGLR